MFTGPCRLAEDRKIFNLEIWWHEFQGPRPTILRHTPPKLGELLERCWQQGSSLRPEFSKILNILRHMAKRVWKSSLSFFLFHFGFLWNMILEQVAEERMDRQKGKSLRRVSAFVRGVDWSATCKWEGCL